MWCLEMDMAVNSQCNQEQGDLHSPTQYNTISRHVSPLLQDALPSVAAPELD